MQLKVVELTNLSFSLIVAILSILQYKDNFLACDFCYPMNFITGANKEIQHENQLDLRQNKISYIQLNNLAQCSLNTRHSVPIHYGRF